MYKYNTGYNTGDSAVGIVLYHKTHENPSIFVLDKRYYILGYAILPKQKYVLKRKLEPCNSI